MNSIRAFRDQLLEYLETQKKLEEQDIEANRRLSDEEKVEAGLLLKDARVIKVLGHQYVLSTVDDNTKLRVGDGVSCLSSGISFSAKIIDLGLGTVTIESSMDLVKGEMLDIEVKQFMLLDPMISLMQNVDDGKPGASFLAMLSKQETPADKGLGAINANLVTTIPDSHNERQLEVIRDVLKRPSVYCIQGPPGTGKTAVLATIAHTFCRQRKEVLVIANTHQAVNNALNKIMGKEKDLRVVKIGEPIKSEGLECGIINAATYNEYLKLRKNAAHPASADVVGMTLHAAVVNLGLRNTGFQPKVVLVDEAGQMPMVYASLIGAFGSGSIVFIGDDRQMPPIYHPRLVAHPLSRSIFEYLCHLYPQLRHTLNVTYRMNEEITRFVSRCFYEPLGKEFRIVSSEYSRGRKFPIKNLTIPEGDDGLIIKTNLESGQSIVLVEQPTETDSEYTDSNPFEANTAIKYATAALDGGVDVSDIAIITPYRKQVKMFVSNWTSHYDMPLINTVECLQGQDVELIVISFAAADPTFVRQQIGFILDAHRLNVMISRAKTKVVMIMSSEVKKEFLAKWGNYISSPEILPSTVSGPVCRGR